MGPGIFLFIYMVVVIFGATIWVVANDIKKNGTARKKSSPLTVFFLILLCIAAFAFLFIVVV